MQCELSGGQVKCQYCGALNLIRERRVDQPPATQRGATDPGSEVARLARLKAQVAHPVHGHIYDLERTPVGLLHAKSNVMMLAAEWNRLVSLVRGGGSVDQHRFCWVAARTAHELVGTGEVLKGRAVLETAADLLEDPNHRHIMRCRLAFAAAQVGEVTAAADWLAACDPAPEVLELDGEYRVAAARLALARKDPAAALAVLGDNARDIPCDKPHRGAFAALRIAALEDYGNLPGAIIELRGNASRARPLLNALGLAPAARAAYDKEAAAERLRQQAAARKAVKMLKGCGVLFTLGIAAIVAGNILYARYEPFPLTCEHSGEITIDGRSENMKGTLVKAPYGCTITITDSKLRGDKIIDAGYNAKIRIENSDLRGNDGLFALANNVDLVIEDSKLVNKGDDPLIGMGYSSSLKIRGGEMRSKGALVKSVWGTTVDIEGAKIKGSTGDWAFVTSYNTTHKLTKLKLKGKGGLIGGGTTYSNKLTLVDVQFDGGDAADALIKLGYKAEIRLKKSKLSGPRAGILTKWDTTTELDNSSLKVGAEGIVNEWGSTVRLKKSRLKASSVGVTTQYKTRVELIDKSKIEGAATGISCTYNCSVMLKNSDIIAKRLGVVADRQLTLTTNGGRIKGSTAAIKSGRGHSVSLTGTKIDGPQELEER